MMGGSITIESAYAQRALGAAAIASGDYQLYRLPLDSYGIARGGAVLSWGETKWAAEWSLGMALWSCDKSIMCPVDTAMRQAGRRKPDLQGHALVDAVRELLGIPAPKATAAPWAGLPLMRMM
jgi:hypothetical protein